MNYRERAVIEKMRKLCRLTGGKDMRGIDFRCTIDGVMHDEFGSYTAKQIRDTGYANGASVWASLWRFSTLDRYVYQAPECGLWVTESLLCWKSDFLRDHADVIEQGQDNFRSESRRVIEAMCTIRNDRRFRRIFLLNLEPQWTKRDCKGPRGRLVNSPTWFFHPDRDRDESEAFMELAEICGIFKDEGRNPNGLLGRVWSYVPQRRLMLLPLIYHPLEAYLARPHRQLELVWDADQQRVGA